MRWTSLLLGSHRVDGPAIARASMRTVSKCSGRIEMARSNIDTWCNGRLWWQSWIWHRMQGFRSVRYAIIYTTAPSSLLLCVSSTVSLDAQHPSDEYGVRAGCEEDYPEPSVCRLRSHKYHALPASASDQSFTAAKSIVPDTTQSADVAAKASLSHHIGYSA